MGKTWNCRGSSIEIERKLRNELVDVFQEQKESVGWTSAANQFEYVKSCLGADKAKHMMSYQTVNSFMKDKHKAARDLKKDHQGLLHEFVNMPERQRMTSFTTEPSSSSDEV